MNIYILMFTTALFYGLYNVFIKLASSYINQITWAIILQITAVIIGVLYYMIVIWTWTHIQITTKWVIFSIIAWFFVGSAEILTFIIFSKWIDVSIWTPIIIGWSILIASIIWLLFMNEILWIKEIFWIWLIVWWISLLTLWK